MRADNSHHLVAAARRRSDTTRDKATRALDRLVRDGAHGSLTRRHRARNDLTPDDRTTERPTPGGEPG